MGDVPHRARSLESVVSICILVVLFLIGLGVFIKQFDSDISRFGIDATAAGLSLQKSEVNQKAEILLSCFLPAGFKTLSEIQIYDSENLYEKINGKAPLYTESGFVELSTQRFVNINDESLLMELYVFDMGGIRNAFSVYSVQRRAEGEIVPALKHAYKTSNAVYFILDKYYIEMVGYSESKRLVGAMLEIVNKIAADPAVDKGTGIAELALFDKEDLVAGSTKLYLANAFGFEGLSNIFTARYDIDGQGITAFLSKRSDRQNAQAVCESYYKFLIDNGATARQASNKILEGKVVDFYGSTEIVSAVGPFVVGIHEADSQASAESLVLKLIGRLGKLEAVKND